MKRRLGVSIMEGNAVARETSSLQNSKSSIDMALIYNLNSDKSESLLKKISLLAGAPILICNLLLQINILSLITGAQGPSFFQVNWTQTVSQIYRDI